MTFRYPAYESRHIATDPLHIKQESRYAVIRLRDGRRISEHVWSCDAERAVNDLHIAEGACAQCSGKGWVVTDWERDGPTGGTCPSCRGSGLSQ